MFSYFLNFNIIKGVLVDYMYGVLFGVIKVFLNWWFKFKYSQEEWYCGDKLFEIDRMLIKIKFFNEILRTLRSIEYYRKYWKGDLSGFILSFLLKEVD